MVHKKLTISIICCNVAPISSECFRLLLENTSDLESTQFVLTNNGSTDNTKELLDTIEFPDKIVIHNDSNVGFIKAHNNALTLAKGDYFLVLNDDLFIYEKDWDSKLINFLNSNNYSVVGLHGTNCTFREDGCGYIGDSIDYIEGSFLVGKTDLFRTYGLFSEDLTMYECEDSDLSLRYKQMGHELGHFNMSFVHKGQQTIKNIDNNFKWEFCGKNRQILRDRWSNYIRTKSFSNKILVSISSLGIGDIVCATPTITALRSTHPTSLIDVESRFPDVFLNNRQVHNHYTYGNAPNGIYDRVVRLEPDFSREYPLHKLFAEIAHVTLTDPTPNLVLTDQEILESRSLIDSVKKNYDYLIVCSLLMRRREWKGRNWSIDNANEFVRLLRLSLPDNYCIVEVGQSVPSTQFSDVNLVDKTTLRQLFSVISLSDLFIGIDSLSFHVAQAFKKKSLVLFGATRPYTRVIDESLVVPVINPDLGCVGCYHDKKQSVFNNCDREDELCMLGITPYLVLNSVEKVINNR